MAGGSIGRPLGSANRRCHSAGGARENAGRKRKPPPRGQRTITNAFAAGNQQAVPAAGDTKHHSNASYGNSDDHPEVDHVQIDLALEEERISQRERQEMINLIKKIEGDDSILHGLMDGLPCDEEQFDIDHDEDLDDQEDDCDLDNDGNDENVNDDNNSGQANRKDYHAYQPPLGSPQFEYINNVKDQIINGNSHSKLRDKALQGMHWIMPECNPICSVKGLPTEPNPWYIADIICYFWDPFMQYRLDPKTCKCIRCGDMGNLKANGTYRWRPMLKFENVVWVIYRRFLCKSCGKSAATIDPKFMSTNVPTHIADGFPFIVPPRGVGIHDMMLYLFADMVTKRVQFGTFASAFNRLYRLKYDKCRLSYLMLHASRRNGIQSSSFEPFSRYRYPTPFSKFNEPSGYNGIGLTSRRIKLFFRAFMASHEPYMQAHAQTMCDKGIATDHSHKYANAISLPGTSTNIYSASYTVTSLRGAINLNRLTFTKSADELVPLLGKLTKVRANAGAPPLLRFENDDNKVDGRVWRQHFPSLQEGVVRTVSMEITGMPHYTIDAFSYVYIFQHDAANHWALANLEEMERLSGQPKVYVGLDCEWNFDADPGVAIEKRMQTLQLSFKGEKAAVIHLSAMNANDAATFPPTLKQLLEHDFFYGCGCNVGTDLGRLKHEFGVVVKNSVELRYLAHQHDRHQPNGTGLQALCQRYIGKNIDKSGQRAKYSVVPLPEDLQMYAALDSIVSRQLVETLHELIDGQLGGVLEIPTGNAIATGMEVEVHIGGRHVAMANISSVGSNEGEIQTWGDTRIGNGKALVSLTKILMPHAKLPYTLPEWPSNADMGWVFDNHATREVGVRTSCIRLRRNIGKGIHDSFSSRKWVAQSYHPQEQQERRHGEVAPITMGSQHNACADVPEASNHLIQGLKKSEDFSQDIFDDEVGIDDSDPHFKGAGSRLKEDIFHAFYNLPIPRSSPFRPAIVRLLIQSTFQFVFEDYQSYAKFLIESNKVQPEGLMDNFYFNRERWRRHVRMPAFPAEVHASNIRKTHAFIAEKFPDLYSAEVRTYFERFEKKCRDGKYEDLSDVNMYTPGLIL